MWCLYHARISYFFILLSITIAFRFYFLFLSLWVLILFWCALSRRISPVNTWKDICLYTTLILKCYLNVHIAVKPYSAKLTVFLQMLAVLKNLDILQLILGINLHVMIVIAYKGCLFFYVSTRTFVFVYLCRIFLDRFSSDFVCTLNHLPEFLNKKGLMAHPHRKNPPFSTDLLGSTGF